MHAFTGSLAALGQSSAESDKETAYNAIAGPNTQPIDTVFIVLTYIAIPSVCRYSSLASDTVVMIAA